MRVKVRWLSSERPPVLATTEYFLSFSMLFWCFCRWEADFSSCSWWQADVISKWDLVRLVSTQKRRNIPYLCSTAHVGIFLLNKVWRLKTVEWCCYVLLSVFLLWLPQPPSAWGAKVYILSGTHVSRLYLPVLIRTYFLWNIASTGTRGVQMLAVRWRTHRQDEGRAVGSGGEFAVLDWSWRWAAKWQLHKSQWC